MKIIFFLLLAATVILSLMFLTGCGHYRNKPDEYAGANVVIYQYPAGTKPQTFVPDIPPASPVNPQELPNLESLWDDPSLVVFKNLSERTVKLEINGKEITDLMPYDATPNIHLRKGTYHICLTAKIPTFHFGIWDDKDCFFKTISPRDSASIIYYIP